MKSTNKSKSVQAVPEGFRTLTPYLVIDNASGFIDFVKKAFGAKETFMHKMDDGKIMNANLVIGDSNLMISDTMEGMDGAHTAMLYLYLENVDQVFKKAVDAHATILREPRDEFYGDRAAAVKDEWGNTWWMATHIEDVEKDELERRSKQMLEERKNQEVHT
jgi:PhnB protein